METRNNPFILYQDRVTSTNDVLKELLRKDPTKGEIFLIAKEQTKGRGQFNRLWHSPSGTGLYLSWLFHPDKDFLPWVTRGVGLVLIDLLKDYRIDGSIKIPNDIYVEGKKIAGILTEAIHQGDLLVGVVVGIGLNLNQERSELEKEGLNATTMALHTDVPVDGRTVGKALVEKLKQLNNRTTEEIEREVEHYRIR